MKNLFETSTADEVRERLSQLQADSERLRGRMTVGQMLAHCSVSMSVLSGTSSSRAR